MFRFSPSDARWLALPLLLACSAGAESVKGEGKAAPREAAPAAAEAAAEEVEVATVGKAAPDFALPDLDGQTHRLSDHRGKIVVLEWFNPGCPYVKHAHGPGGAMETMAADLASEGVVWMAINSGKPGKQGHGVEVNREAAAGWKMDHPVLMDEDSAVGRKYGAVTTPHMYIVDPDGILRYAGAIDNAPLGEHEGEYRNHVTRALADLGAGGEVTTPRTKPYGCSVKY